MLAAEMNRAGFSVTIGVTSLVGAAARIRRHATVPVCGRDGDEETTRLSSQAIKLSSLPSIDLNVPRRLARCEPHHGCYVQRPK
ncbi:hypothetical protein [Mycobacterium seoulense]|uniref:hypothetical protein n=1 Tax=Mycobacterium seoulense TaxID=386911 RepID=UPI003CEAFBE6